MTDPLAPDDLEQRLRAALARRATRDDGATTDDINTGLDDLLRRIGAPAETASGPVLATAIAQALRSAGDTVIPLPGSDTRPTRRRRDALLAAVAALALVAAGVAFAARHDDPTRPGLHTTDDLPAEGPSGWYVPRDLPDGWQLRSARITTARSDAVCPCSRRAWAGEGPTADPPLRGLTRGGPAVHWEDEVEVGDGVSGSVWTAGAEIDVAWTDELGTARLSTTRHSRNGAIAVARSLVNVAEPPTPAGYRLVESWAISRQVASYKLIDLRYATPAGAEVVLAAGATGTGGHLKNAFVPRVPLSDDIGLGGADRPVLADRPPDNGLQTPANGARSLLGRWPGGDVVVSGGDAGGPRPSAADLRTLLDALRPASPEEWAALVAAAPPDAITGPVTGVPATAAGLLTAIGDAPTAGRNDVLTVEITTGPFAGMAAEVGPVPIEVRKDATAVKVTAVLTNPTDATIDGPGCAFGDSQVGLAEEAAVEPEIWQRETFKCAVERSRYEPGSRTPIAWTLAFSEAQQASDDTEYRAVIEAGDDALHLEVPVRVDRGPRTGATAEGPVTTASPTTTEPAEPGDTPPESAATTEPADRGDEFADLTGLTFALELRPSSMRAGDAVDGALVVRNPTDHDVAFTECTELATTSGLVPADQPDAELPRNVIRDCYATERHSAKAGRTTRIPLLRRIVARTPTPGSLSGYGGDLPAGAYLAVVEIPGRTSTVRLTLPVTLDPSDCPGRTTALVARYAGLTRAQAKDLAAAEGRTTRVSAIDGRDLAVEADLRCDRVNLDLSGGRVMDISLG